MSGGVDLAAFDGRSLQNAATILSLFTDLGSARDAIAREISARLKEEITGLKIIENCPQCGATVNCMAVNTPGKKCRQVGGGYKSLSFCTNSECSYAQYSTKGCS